MYVEISNFDWSLFFEIILLKHGLLDGIFLTLGLALSIWVISAIIGFIFCEIKFALPTKVKFLVDMILWLCRSTPILVLLVGMYYTTSPYGVNQYIVAISALSFWATAEITTILYRYKQYIFTKKKLHNQKISYWIIAPDVIRFMAKIITIIPIVSFIALPDFFFLMMRQLESTHMTNEIFSGAIVVYLSMIAIISVIAKIIEKMLNVPEQLL